mgnify:CR=1 FL=1|jgi:hypothetical protein
MILSCVSQCNCVGYIRLQSHIAARDPIFLKASLKLNFNDFQTQVRLIQALVNAVKPIVNVDIVHTNAR